MVPASSVKVPRVSTYSGYRHVDSPFAYGAFTLSGRLSQNRSARLIESITRSEPQNARALVWALPVPLAATPGITVVFSSSGYLDVSVHQVPLLTLWIGVRILEVCSSGFPHSDISGSSDICSSPKLFAAYHVFHRLLVPRHPPYALFIMTKTLIYLGCLFSLRFFLVCGFQGTLQNNDFARRMFTSVSGKICCFIACLHATERTRFSRCNVVSTLLTDVLSVIRSLDESPTL